MSEIAIVPAAAGRNSASVFDAGDLVPALYAPDATAARRAFEFFAVNIRNPNTRKAYARAASDFALWCELHGIADVRQVQPVHVAAYIEGLYIAAPSVKQRLAALRMLFDWLVIGQVMPTNPASSVRGPRHSVKKGKTPVLAAGEPRPQAFAHASGATASGRPASPSTCATAASSRSPSRWPTTSRRVPPGSTTAGLTR